MTALEPARPRTGAAAACVAALLALSALSLGVGVGDVDLGRFASDPEAWRLVVESRAPRTFAAILSGAGLAIAGLVMQTLARNRFVEPATAGTAQSAGLGLLAATLLWPASSLPAKTLVASAAALAGTAVFLMVARRLPPHQPYLVPLFGLVYGATLGSALTFAAWQSDMIQYLEVWTVGEFSGVLRGRYELLWVAGAMVALAWWTADRLTILSLGREASVGLGLDYARMMQVGLAIVSVVAALTVVVVGIIPFVGLVAPNLVTRIRGDDVRGALPSVALVGAGLTLACDILGRLIRYPYEIPVGVVLGVVGAALFLWLLMRRPAHG